MFERFHAEPPKSEYQKPLEYPKSESPNTCPTSMMDAVRDLELKSATDTNKMDTTPAWRWPKSTGVYEAQGPALFFERVKGSPSPAVSNIYGTFERRSFFRHTLKKSPEGD